MGTLLRFRMILTSQALARFIAPIRFSQVGVAKTGDVSYI